MWKPGSYPIACGPQHIGHREGYTYRGLGLHKVSDKPEWNLTHLGSGHAVAVIKGTVAEAFPIATEIAESADWDFDGLNGWRNRDPELPAKVMAIMAKYKKRVKRKGGNPSDEAARLVVMERAE